MDREVCSVWGEGASWYEILKYKKLRRTRGKRKEQHGTAQTKNCFIAPTSPFLKNEVHAHEAHSIKSTITSSNQEILLPCCDTWMEASLTLFSGPNLAICNASRISRSFLSLAAPIIFG